MKIGIVGGGPAGLYFALLMKQQNRAYQIQILEQNTANNTYGWGVVFSGRALALLQDSDPEVYADLADEIEQWDDLTIVHRGQAIPIDGSHFSGLARIRLLQVLQDHCHNRGIDIAFETRLQSLDVFADCDLIVAADGVNSRIRELKADHFQPQRRYCTNKYIWYGTTRVFDTLSLIFRKNNDGVFVAHSYRYSPTMSTFIVECDAQTWEHAGFAQMSDAASRTYCETIFSADLQGQPLLSNNAAWLNFAQVSNEHWFHENIVLLGDALRSVHFSIGSGTRTAMQDASALAAAFAEYDDDVATALASFEKNHRPRAQQLMEVAQGSIDWYENFRSAMRFEPMPFVMDYMTRGGRVELAALRQRSPHFVAAWEQAQNFS